MVMKDGRRGCRSASWAATCRRRGTSQVLLNLIDFGMNIQEAGEAPRFRHSGDGLALESAISADARFGLSTARPRLINQIGVFGGFQGILIDPEDARPDGRLGSAQGRHGRRAGRPYRSFQRAGDLQQKPIRLGTF